MLLVRALLYVGHAHTDHLVLPTMGHYHAADQHGAAVPARAVTHELSALRGA